MKAFKLLVYLSCLFSWKIARTNTLNHTTNVKQKGGFISANVGENLTLDCFYTSDAAKYYWYKQILGQKLQLISVTYKFDQKGSFQDEFKDDPRLSLETDSGKNHLKIQNLRISDSATYFCASGYSFMFEFGEGTTISVKGAGLDIPAVVQQSVSGTIHSGDSVTLNCTVHTGTCDGNHSVYWFKDSGKSHEGIIYTQEERNNQCEKKTETQAHTCVYNLPIKNMDHSNSGTYYCALASCGHILFGNGTKLDFDEEENPVLVYVLSGAVTFTSIVCVLLIFLICKMSKTSCKCSDIQTEFMASSTTDAEGCQDKDNLHYAALNVRQTNKSKKERNDNLNECVYSSVRQ